MCVSGGGSLALGALGPLGVTGLALGRLQMGRLRPTGLGQRLQHTVAWRQGCDCGPLTELIQWVPSDGRVQARVPGQWGGAAVAHGPTFLASQAPESSREKEVSLVIPGLGLRSFITEVGGPQWHTQSLGAAAPEREVEAPDCRA